MITISISSKNKIVNEVSIINGSEVEKIGNYKSKKDILDEVGKLDNTEKFSLTLDGKTKGSNYSLKDLISEIDGLTESNVTVHNF